MVFANQLEEIIFISAVKITYKDNVDMLKVNKSYDWSPNTNFPIVSIFPSTPALPDFNTYQHHLAERKLEEKYCTRFIVSPLC